MLSINWSEIIRPINTPNSLRPIKLTNKLDIDSFINEWISVDKGV